jgi:hypothetical protein
LSNKCRLNYRFVQIYLVLLSLYHIYSSCLDPHHILPPCETKRQPVIAKAVEENNCIFFVIFLQENKLFFQVYLYRFEKHYLLLLI